MVLNAMHRSGRRGDDSDVPMKLCKSWWDRKNGCGWQGTVGKVTEEGYMGDDIYGKREIWYEKGLRVGRGQWCGERTVVWGGRHGLAVICCGRDNSRRTQPG